MQLLSWQGMHEPCTRAWAGRQAVHMETLDKLQLAQAGLQRTMFWLLLMALPARLEMQCIAPLELAAHDWQFTSQLMIPVPEVTSAWLIP